MCFKFNNVYTRILKFYLHLNFLKINLILHYFILKKLLVKGEIQ